MLLNHALFNKGEGLRLEALDCEAKISEPGSSCLLLILR